MKSTQKTGWEDATTAEPGGEASRQAGGVWWAPGVGCEERGPAQSPHAAGLRHGVEAGNVGGRLQSSCVPLSQGESLETPRARKIQKWPRGRSWGNAGGLAARGGEPAVRSCALTPATPTDATRALLRSGSFPQRDCFTACGTFTAVFLQ